MKIKLKVEKDYKGKRYYPNIEYVVDDETAKDILSKTKYAEAVEENQVKEEVSEEVVQAVASAIVEQAEEDNKSVEEVVGEIIIEKEQKPTKRNKK